MRKLILYLLFCLTFTSVTAQTKVYVLEKCIVIEKNGIYPIGKLFAAEKNGNFLFSAVTENEAKYNEFSIKWSNIEDGNGDPFASLDDTRTYLAGILGNDFSVLAIGGATEAKQDSVFFEVKSKINRIKGSDDYNRAFTYDLVGTENILTITHTGTTANGVETIVETLTYVDPAVNGSNITNISYL